MYGDQNDKIMRSKISGYTGSHLKRRLRIAVAESQQPAQDTSDMVVGFGSK